MGDKKAVMLGDLPFGGRLSVSGKGIGYSNDKGVFKLSDVTDTLMQRASGLIVPSLFSTLLKQSKILFSSEREGFIHSLVNEELDIEEKKAFLIAMGYKFFNTAKIKEFDGELFIDNVPRRVSVWIVRLWSTIRKDENGNDMDPIVVASVNCGETKDMIDEECHNDAYTFAIETGTPGSFD